MNSLFLLGNIRQELDGAGPQALRLLWVRNHRDDLLVHHREVQGVQQALPKLVVADKGVLEERLALVRHLGRGFGLDTLQRAVRYLPVALSFIQNADLDLVHLLQVESAVRNAVQR